MKTRIEKSIESALGSARRSSRSSAPPKLAAALDYAVKPGGARIRPTILTSVALACGDDRPDLTNAAAASLEDADADELVAEKRRAPAAAVPDAGAP